MAELFEVPLKTITGDDASLADYSGKVMLVVNVASKCGLTPQYEGLQSVYRQYREQGLVVLGFPANDFKGQEPGSNEEIQQFCSLNYQVDFPMFGKIVVTGADKHPLYQALTALKPDALSKPGQDFRKALEGYGIAPNPVPEILWNFEKFLIGRDGTVLERFSPDLPPNDPIVTAAIEKALAA